MSPEMIENKGYSGFTCDIWSMGIFLYFLLMGTFPFLANDLEELNKMILKGFDEKIEHISPEV